MARVECKEAQSLLSGRTRRLGKCFGTYLCTYIFEGLAHLESIWLVLVVNALHTITNKEINEFLSTYKLLIRSFLHSL